MTNDDNALPPFSFFFLPPPPTYMHTHCFLTYIFHHHILSIYRTCLHDIIRTVAGTSTTNTEQQDKAKADAAAAATDNGTHGPVVHFRLTPQKHPLAVTKLDPNEKIWEVISHLYIYPTHLATLFGFL